MNTRSARGGILAAAVLASALLAAPAQAAPIVAEEGAAACEVTGGTLSWGLKESFRSYISGSIANGSWEPSDGATYETPEFTWSSATGTIDPDAGTGTVSFTGTVNFTGHDGVLDLTLANPTIEFEGDGEAALMLDARSTDVEGEVTVDEDQVWFAAVTVEDPLAPVDNRLELAAMPAALTNSGANAFAGFYEAEADLDPVSIGLEFGDCASAAAAPAEEQPAEQPIEAAAPEQSIPWIPITIGAIALLVIGVTSGMLIAGRKKKPGSAQGPAPQEQSQGAHASQDPVDELFGDQEK